MKDIILTRMAEGVDTGLLDRAHSIAYQLDRIGSRGWTAHGMVFDICSAVPDLIIHTPAAVTTVLCLQQAFQDVAGKTASLSCPSWLTKGAKFTKAFQMQRAFQKLFQKSDDELGSVMIVADEKTLSYLEDVLVYGTPKQKEQYEMGAISALESAGSFKTSLETRCMFMRGDGWRQARIDGISYGPRIRMGHLFKPEVT